MIDWPGTSTSQQEGHQPGTGQRQLSTYTALIASTSAAPAAPTPTAPPIPTPFAPGAPTPGTSEAPTTSTLDRLIEARIQAALESHGLGPMPPANAQPVTHPHAASHDVQPTGPPPTNPRLPGTCVGGMEGLAQSMNHQPQSFVQPPNYQTTCLNGCHYGSS